MNQKEHLISALIVLVIMYSTGVMGIFAPREQLLIGISFILASGMIDPDIDLKLPLISHRGSTHNMTVVLIIFTVVAVISSVVLTMNEYPEIGKLVWFVIIGIILGWLVHVIMDLVHSRINKMTWIIISAIIIIALYLIR